MFIIRILRKVAVLTLTVLVAWCSSSMSQTNRARVGALNNVRKCDYKDYSGADAGAKIASCIADLTATGGVADATGFEGPQIISSNLTLGSSTKPVQLLLNPGAQYTLNNATIILSNGSSIDGGYKCRETGKCATLKRTSGTTTMISATGAGGNHVRGFSLHGLILDGGNTNGHGIVIDYADTFTIDDVEVVNGGQSNALRLLDEVWDFTIQKSVFAVWGSSTGPQYTIEMLGLNGGSQITDGHWFGNQIGEVTTGAPLLHANGFVLQQRFIDDKFHTSGGAMTHLIDWSGYYSDFIGCSYQGDTASSSGGSFRIKNADNRVIGGQFSDLAFGDGIHISGAGAAIVVGVTFHGSASPSPGSAIVTEAAATGNVSLFSNEVINLTRGYDFRNGNNKFDVGPFNSTGVTTPIDIPAAIGGATWADWYTAHSTVTIGAQTANAARAAGSGNNPALSIGGNSTITNVAGNQNITALTGFSAPGQINESIGLGSGSLKLSGIGNVDGTGIQHTIVWGYDADATVFEIYKKAASASVAPGGRLVAISNTGDIMFTLNKGQHIEPQAAQSDVAGTLTLSAGAQTMTFNVAYASKPSCVVSSTTTNPAYIDEANFTNAVLAVKGTGTDKVYYHCFANPN